MLIDILNKLFFVLFFLSIVNIVRTGFFLIGSFIKSDSEKPEKFRLTVRQLFLLGVSIAYVFSTLITGIGI
jgi:Ni,Fe-hydrogenase I cytochrome b subunit